MNRLKAPAQGTFYFNIFCFFYFFSQVSFSQLLRGFQNLKRYNNSPLTGYKVPMDRGADMTWDYKTDRRITMRLQKITVMITVRLQKVTVGITVGLQKMPLG